MTNVVVTCKNNLGLITLNNPLIHNALGASDVVMIRESFLRWESKKLDAIIITGTGESFSSGLFLGDFDKRDWDKNPVTSICEDIERCGIPVICALNGGAYGGAVEIALSCDFRVASNRLCLQIPAARLGIHYEPCGVKRALNVLGVSLVRRLFLLGEVISLQDIKRTDFVDFWAGDDETVIGKSKKIAGLLGSNAPLAVSGMKTLINEILNGSLDLHSARSRIDQCFKSADHKEALAARKQKRHPKFKGF